MKITPQLLDSVAKTARLRLSEEEKKQFAKEFSSILGHFEAISRIPTKGVKPSFHPVPLRNVVRSDTPHQCISQSAALSNVVAKERGYVKGPRVI